MLEFSTYNPADFPKGVQPGEGPVFYIVAPGLLCGYCFAHRTVSRARGVVEVLILEGVDLRPPPK